MRKHLRPRTRFQILERDNFTCQYCGKSASHVELEVDHVIPVAKGGRNDYFNLVTACQECNIGKRDEILTTFPPSYGKRRQKFMNIYFRIKHMMEGYTPQKHLEFERGSIGGTIELCQNFDPSNLELSKLYELWVEGKGTITINGQVYWTEDEPEWL